MASMESDKMAKVTKKMLKGIVKECLVEILSEGIGGSDELFESSRSRSTRPSSNAKRKKSIFDQIDASFERKARSSDNDTFDDKITQAASVATSSPVLRSILEDTARTTLQEQLQHESSAPSMSQSAMSQPPSNGDSLMTPGQSGGLDIDSLFGEATRNWGEVLDRTERKVS
jgi:hypothetical protein